MNKQLPAPLKAVRMMVEGGGGFKTSHFDHSGAVYRPFGMREGPGQRIAPITTLYEFFIDNVPDPDWALAQNPQFDELIRQQVDVHACMRLRELSVASMPAVIESSQKKGIDKNLANNVADYVSDVFDNLPNRVDLYKQMQSAVLMGGQGHEWIWQRVEGYWRPTRYFPIHKTRFSFDRLGNLAILTRMEPVYGMAVQPNPDQITANPWTAAVFGKFTYHKYCSEGGPWTRPANEGYLYWGRGEDTNLFIPVTFDQFVLRFQMKWLEKHGIPLAVLYYPENEDVSSQVMQICESIREESVVRIPRPGGADTNFDGWYHLDFIQPSPEGFQAFMDFHNSWTKPAVEKILLGGANMMELGDNGSYGAVVNQRDAGMDIVFRYDAVNIDETLNTQLIPAIVQARFPGLPSKYYPKHRMASDKREDQGMRLDVLGRAAELVPIAEDEIYEAAGTKKPKEGVPTVFLGNGQDSGAASDMFDMFPGLKPADQGEDGDGQEQPDMGGNPNTASPQKNGKPRKATPIGRGGNRMMGGRNKIRR